MVEQPGRGMLLTAGAAVSGGWGRGGQMALVPGGWQQLPQPPTSLQQPASLLPDATDAWRRTFLVDSSVVQGEAPPAMFPVDLHPELYETYPSGTWAGSKRSSKTSLVAHTAAHSGHALHVGGRPSQPAAHDKKDLSQQLSPVKKRVKEGTPPGASSTHWANGSSAPQVTHNSYHTSHKWVIMCLSYIFLFIYVFVYLSVFIFQANVNLGFINVAGTLVMVIRMNQWIFKIVITKNKVIEPWNGKVSWISN